MVSIRWYFGCLKGYLDSQVAGNDRPLYPKVDHYWLQVAHNYEPLALQVVGEVLAGAIRSTQNHGPYPLPRRVQVSFWYIPRPQRRDI